VDVRPAGLCQGYVRQPLHMSTCLILKRWRAPGRKCRIDQALDVERTSKSVSQSSYSIMQAISDSLRARGRGLRYHRRRRPQPAATRHADDAIVDRRRA
jgi:hypothetical protein